MKCVCMCMYVCVSIYIYQSVQFSSVAQSCLILCDPMDCSMPGFPVHHQLLELTQTHVHRVGDAIQPFHPLWVSFSSYLQSFPVSEFFPMSQFFTSGGQSIQASASASVLPMNIQDWSPCSPSDPQESFPTPQFQSINSLVLLYLKLYNLNYICKISFTMYCKLVSGSRDSVMDIFRSPFCPPCQVICRIIR